MQSSLHRLRPRFKVCAISATVSAFNGAQNENQAKILGKLLGGLLDETENFALGQRFLGIVAVFRL